MSLSDQLAAAMGEDLGTLHLHPGRKNQPKKARVGRGDGTLKGAGTKAGKGTTGDGHKIRHKTIPI